MKKLNLFVVLFVLVGFVKISAVYDRDVEVKYASLIDRAEGSVGRGQVRNGARRSRIETRKKTMKRIEAARKTELGIILAAQAKK